MKTLLFTCLLILCSFFLGAQPPADNAYFISPGALIGNHAGVTLDLNFQFNQSYAIAFGFNSFSQVPSRKHLWDFHVMAGKVLPSRSGNLRWNLALGFVQSRSKPRGMLLEKSGYNDGRIKEDTPAENAYLHFESDDKVHYGIILNPKLEILFTKMIGCTLSAIYSTNDGKSVYGVGIGLIAGKLR